MFPKEPTIVLCFLDLNWIVSIFSHFFNRKQLPDANTCLRTFFTFSVASDSSIRSTSSRTTWLTLDKSTFSLSSNSFNRSGVATRISTPFATADSCSSDFFFAVKTATTDRSLTIDWTSSEICLAKGGKIDNATSFSYAYRYLLLMLQQEHVVHVHQLIRLFCHFGVIQPVVMHRRMFFLNQLMLGLNNRFARKRM